jgi:DNA segregation ATPase FtsK/SpoIIIE-like protein
VASTETYSNTESVVETKLQELKAEMEAKKEPILVATEAPSTEDKQEDDPVYQEVYAYLEANPEASTKLLMGRFRVGEARAERLRKYITGKLDRESEVT